MTKAKMSLYVSRNDLIEFIRKEAEKKGWSDFPVSKRSIHSLTGGNVEDAYAGGCGDGAIRYAKTMLAYLKSCGTREYGISKPEWLDSAGESPGSEGKEL